MRTIRVALLSVPVLACVLMTACDSSPAPTEAKDVKNLNEQSKGTITDFKNADPTIEKFFKSSYGYVVFPSIRSGAIGVGGAYGRGEVFEKGKMIGYADLSQATIGAQLGGQRYAEIVFFQNEGDFADFKTKEVQFDARASAIAASKGAATAADYQRGVAVFTLPEGGLMFQAAIGGQKFRYEPLAK